MYLLCFLVEKANQWWWQSFSPRMQSHLHEKRDTCIKARANSFNISVLEIIFLYSEDICPFKSSFWSDIWQIGPDIIYWLTTPWRRELKMCWWHVRSSCPIIMWNWPDIFKIWSDNVRWPTVISSTDICFNIHSILLNDVDRWGIPLGWANSSNTSSTFDSTTRGLVFSSRPQLWLLL